MSRTLSPSTGKPYGLARVAAAWDLSRSTYYARRHRRAHPIEFRKRGPRTPWSDEALTERIREQIATSPFSRGRTPQGMGTLAGSGNQDLQGPGPAPDAAGPVAGAPAPSPTRL